LGFDFLRVLRNDERPVHGDGTHRQAEGFLRFSGVSVAYWCTDGHGVRALGDPAGLKMEKVLRNAFTERDNFVTWRPARGHFNFEAN